MDLAIDSGAEDIEINEDHSITIITHPDKLQEVAKSLNSSNIQLEESEITLLPETTISLDHDTSLSVYRLLEILEDLDDTQNVHSNAEFSSELMKQI